MFNISPAVLGLLRGVGFVVLTSVLTYLGNATNLTSVLSPQVASIIAIIALALEHKVEGKTGNALFGAVHTA